MFTSNLSSNVPYLCSSNILQIISGNNFFFNTIPTFGHSSILYLNNFNVNILIDFSSTNRNLLKICKLVNLKILSLIG